MRILITRPEPSASATAKKLSDVDHEPVIFPMSRRQCEEMPPQDDLYFASALIFTSANALHCLKKTSLIKDELLNKPVYAVGEKTKQFACDIGFKKILAGTGNGTGLADLIIQDCKTGRLKPNADNPLVYLTAEDRTPHLEAKLTENDLQVTPIIIYKMVTDFSYEEFKNLLDNSAIDVVLFYSQSAVRRFFAANAGYERKLFTSLRYGCLSKEIAAAIPDEFLNQIDIATEPSEHHLLACIGN